MTQIKKFGFGAIATALFAVLAMATLVNTAYAAVGSVTPDSLGFAPGSANEIVIVLDDIADEDEVSLVADSDDATVNWEPTTGSILVCEVTSLDDTLASEAATLTCNGEEFDLTATGDGGAGTIDGTLTIDLEAADDSEEDAVDITVTHGASDGTATVFVAGTDAGVGDLDSISIDAPGAVADGGAIDATINTADEDGDEVDTTVTVFLGGAGTLFETANGSGICAATDTGEEVNQCTVDTDDGEADILGEADGDSGDSIQILAAVAGISDSAEITIGGTTTDSVTVAAESLAAGATGTITVTVLDEDGNAVADDEDVSVNASAGVVFGCTDTDAGVATCNFIAPDSAQTVTIVAAADSETGTATVVVTAADPGEPGEPGDGSLSTPSFGTGNVGSAVFDGGTIAELSAAVTASGGTAVWVQGTDGNWYRYNTLATGATAFVNNAFEAQFAAGLGNVAVFVVR